MRGQACRHRLLMCDHKFSKCMSQQAAVTCRLLQCLPLLHELTACVGAHCDTNDVSLLPNMYMYFTLFTNLAYLAGGRQGVHHAAAHRQAVLPDVPDRRQRWPDRAGAAPASATGPCSAPGHGALLAKSSGGFLKTRHQHASMCRGLSFIYSCSHLSLYVSSSCVACQQLGIAVATSLSGAHPTNANSTHLTHASISRLDVSD